MSAKWEEYQYNNPAMANIVQPGLDKLEAYKERADLVPAYVVAMSKWDLHSAIQTYKTLPVINPTIKLDWYAEKMPDRVEWAKNIFMEEVCIIHIILCSLAC